MTTTLAIRILVLLLAVQACAGQPLSPALFRDPTMHGGQLVFSFADHLWTVNQDGGEARRLTNGVAEFDSNPVLSPDGQWIAFTGRHHSNTDVYVMPATGGAPRRLTYHPAADDVVGWTPDSQRVLFRSSRESVAEYERLFTISVDGGLAEALPMPIAVDGCFSPDGKSIAYVALDRAFGIWKDYRGGRTTSIRILNLETGQITELPRQNANDFRPRWVGETIYFLSDRDGEAGLFSYNLRTGKTATLVQKNTGNLKSFSAGADGIIYEQFGGFHFFDALSGKHRPIPIEISADFPETQPHPVSMDAFTDNGGLSPAGDFAVFEARGEIVTVSTATGEGRNMTRTPAVADRMPAWSPDGKWLAYFSDATGEYELRLQQASDPSVVQSLPLGPSPTYYYTPVWSPDSKHIAYTSKRLQLWYVDIEQKKPVLVDTDLFDDPQLALDPSWSPDGKWLAYSKQMPNQAHSIFLYSLASHTTEQLTNQTGDARSPSFDPSGQCIYFVVSTNFGPKIGWDQLSAYRRAASSALYAVVSADSVLSQCGYTSLTASDEDGPAVQGAHSVDWHKAQRRVIPLPFPAKNYSSLVAIKPGTLLVGDRGSGTNWFVEGATQNLSRASIHEGSMEELADGVAAFAVSANGEAVLYKQNGGWMVMSSAKGPESAKALPLRKIEIQVDPRAEWKQMLREAWRLARDFYYDPGMHGKDWKAIGDRYQAYADNLRSRTDLNYLLAEMLGELSTSHFKITGGDVPDAKQVPVGLLGADYGIRNNRYYFKHIYSGGEWNPELVAPLNRPLSRVAEGEYLMEINGKELTAKDNVFSFFENLAFKLVELKVCSDALGQHCRDVSVNPVSSEKDLRYTAWIENNQRLVDKISGGRVAYVHLQDTSQEGYQAFNRYFLSQSDKDAVIIDLRFNAGGLVPDYFMDYLHRLPASYMSPRDGEDVVAPRAAILGPKVTLINEYTESGGEALAWYFRTEHMGKVVGKRTWGGLVGRYGNPDLIDGGSVLIPAIGVWSPQGEWQVENHGVQPDVEVENSDKQDRQLAKAVEIIMTEIQKRPPVKPRRPRYPIFTAGTNND